jgi:aminoglycoside phosphotransferase (APT) family kinase protein
VTDVDALALPDRVRLGRFLGQAAPVDGAILVELLSGGRSNLTYLVRFGKHEYVVRRRPLGRIPAGAHDMAREYKVLAALQSTTIPTPEVFGYCDDESIVGAPFYVMSRVHGSVFHRRADVSMLAPSQARDLSYAAVDVIEQLHRIDYDAVGLSDLGRPDGFVARRIARWLQQWRQGPHRQHQLVEMLGDKLGAALPPRSDATLVHGDFRLGNLLVALDDSVRVAAVLDWEMSTLGDPLTDLAHLLVYWEPTRGRLTHESQTIAQHPGFLTASELANRYATGSGRDLDRLDFYLAFEHWRAAIIKEAIFLRRTADSDQSEPPDDLGDSVDRHLEEAADLLRTIPVR